jgi:transcriptional regulator with XRE-family HTH domain
MPVTSTQTLAGRFKHLRATKGYKSAGDLARALTEAGYPVVRQTIANIERGDVDVPRAGLIHAAAQLWGVSEDEILHGPREGDAWLITELKGLEDDLTEYQQDQRLYLANSMAAETRKARAEQARRDAVTDDELTLLEQIRQAPAGMLDALLAQVQAASGNTSEKSPGRPRTPRAPRQ